ncbi:MAG: hypothetical protein II718_04820 [Clostridiales bacterium]|nr:hypothetical protein [Clostridiales bacterium]
MFRFIFRWLIIFPVMAIAGSVAVIGLINDGDPDYVFGAILVTIISFFIFRALRRKKNKAVQKSAPVQAPVQARVQQPRQPGLLETLLFSKPASTPKTYSAPVNTYQDKRAEEERRRKQEEEERERRKREDYARQADYWERQYYSLLRNDPQCRNYQTRDAEYNKNYFRRLSQGRW